ncbi:hypothetical protein ACVW18_005906 [Bacillus thuringiensis]
MTRDTNLRVVIGTVDSGFRGVVGVLNSFGSRGIK